MRTLNRGGTKALDGFAEKRKLAILMAGTPGFHNKYTNSRKIRRLDEQRTYNDEYRIFEH